MVKPMTKRISVIVACWFALVLSEVSVPAQTEYRLIMHTFQQGSNIMFVAVSESPTGPRGLVRAPNYSRGERAFTVSDAEFDKMWATAMSTEVGKYADGSNQDSISECVTNYVFSVGYVGKSTNYAIPMVKASPAIAALATQFRAYAK